MSRSPIPPGANWLTPYLTVSSVESSLAFYHVAFGFEPGMSMPGPDGKAVHAEMRYRGNGIIMMSPEGAWGSPAKTPKNGGFFPPSSNYVFCDDVDAQYAKAIAAGGTSLMEPADQFWGDRTAMVSDPDGYHWMLATNVGEFDPSKIPPMG